METALTERTSGGTESPGQFSVNDKLPRWGQRVMVITPIFKCLGFLGPDSKWRDAWDGSAIEGVQSWSSMTMEREATS